MKHLDTANDRIDGREDHWACPVWRVGLRTEAVAVLAAALLTLIGQVVDTRHAHAQGEGFSGRSEQPSEPSPRSNFIREIHRKLKDLDQRLSGLNRHLIENRDPVDALRDQLVNQRITTRSAEANYLNAKLTREVAEIAITEYVEGVYVQDCATWDSQILLAESDLIRARGIVAFGGRKEDEHWTRLHEKRASLVLEAARAGKKALVEDTKSRQTKELEAEVAHARIDEMRTIEVWEMEKRKEERLKKAVAVQRSRTPVEHRGPELLRRAASVEERVHAELSRFVEQANSDDALQKEIRDLTNQLGAVVDEAEAVIASDDLADLKPRIRAAAGRAGGPGSK